MILFQFYKKTYSAIFCLLALLASFSVSAEETFDENKFYQALIAEFYNQSGQAKLTLKHYLPLALSSNDPALLKRVTEIATGSAQLKKGLEAAKHWVELSPKDIEARQYLTLLYLRDNQLDKSAEQINFVHQIIEQSPEAVDKKAGLLSKGLKFIGALLVIESHHDKAYEVYQRFIKSYYSGKYTDQQNLILASLAMKAKKYAVVVTALDSIEESDSQYFESAALMKTKALRKLGRLNEAAKLLKIIVKDKKSSDSKRLELTRLFIQIGKKDEASQILNQLMAKHPENYDLLKALIALNIDQKKWQEAKANNQKLATSESYQNDARYFSGEISEAKGNLTEALADFKKVESGSFIKSAHKKIVSLLARLDSLEVAQQWLQSEQQKSKKRKDKAYWLRLEADLLSDKKKTAEALTLYNKIIGLMPKKMSFRYYRGLLYEQDNQIKAAEKDFKFVIGKQKNNANALNALGFLLVKHTQRFDEAKSHIQQAYKLKPNDPTIMDSLGWVYFRTGEIVIAEEYLRKAYKAIKNPQIASHLITVLAKSGQYQEARKLFNEMIKKYPENTSLVKVKEHLKKL